MATRRPGPGRRSCRFLSSCSRCPGGRAASSRASAVACRVNNAVARVAGLLAVAVFGVVLARTFDVRARSALDGLQMTASARTAIDRELPKMAGAEVATMPSIGPAERAAAHEAIAGAFLSAFRLVLTGAAALALGAAIAGACLRGPGAMPR